MKTQEVFFVDFIHPTYGLLKGQPVLIDLK
ncbi:uncharacterized protein METZ01_LOCUS52478 [marine metagenome]|uniref:Uncharacterized protein n=1 Tax=marine metagenome TaxID=408172 RepID=A0A381S818_9ZZZZ